MVRRPTGTQPQRPTLSPEQRRQVIDRLRKRVEELKGFNPATVQSRFGSPEVTALQVAIDDTLAAAFGHGTPDYNRYYWAAQLDHGPVTMSTGFERGPRREDMPDVFQGYLRDGRDQSVALLGQAIRSLEEEMPASTTDGGPAIDYSQNRKVFVVHGRDDGPREAVARFLGHQLTNPAGGVTHGFGAPAPNAEALSVHANPATTSANHLQVKFRLELDNVLSNSP